MGDELLIKLILVGVLPCFAWGYHCLHEEGFNSRVLCSSVTLEPGKPLVIDDYRGAEHLYFAEGGRIENIPAATFQYLSKLTSLTMNEQGIQNIEHHAFIGLESLNYLELIGNNLTWISKEMFNGCPNLLTLDLTRNNIETIQPDTFSDLTYLVNLYLSENNIKSLPNGLFTSLSLLERLDLDYNKLELLRTGMFEGLTNIREIRLQNNEIMRVEHDALYGLSSLDRLSIYNNSLLHLDPVNFAENLKSVEFLELYSSYFECDYFYGLVKALRKYDISIWDPEPYRCIEATHVKESKRETFFSSLFN